MAEKTIHQGRNIKRFREMLQIKQEALAIDLGEDWTQKKVSLLEEKEVIDDAILKQVAQVMKLPKEVFERFDTEAAVSIIASTITNNDHASMHNTIYGDYQVNPVDKWIEALDKNEKLYERLLQSEREKVEMLEKMLREK